MGSLRNLKHISLKQATNSFYQKSNEYTNLKNTLSEKYKADMENLDSDEYESFGAVLRENYKIDIENLENKKKALLDKILANNKILTILLLDYRILPISISDAIKIYSSGNDSTEAQFQRQLYQREVLINFKMALLEMKCKPI